MTTSWRALIVVAFLVGALLRLVMPGAHSLWLDEVSTLEDTRSFQAVIDRVYHPPLFYLLAWIGRALLGDGTLDGDGTAIRIVSGLCGAAGVIVVASLAKRVSGKDTVAAAAAIVFALLPAAVFFAREARMYALWTTLHALWLITLVVAVQSPTRRALAAHAIALLLALFTHHYAFVFSLAPLVLAAYLLRADRKAALVVVAPWFLTAVVQVLRIMIIKDRGSPAGVAEYVGARAVDGGFGAPHLAFGRLLLFENWAYEPTEGIGPVIGVIVLLAVIIATVVVLRTAENKRALSLILASMWPPALALWVLPLRDYTRLFSPLLPVLAVLFAMLVAVVINRVRARAALRVAILVVSTAIMGGAIAPYLAHVYTREIEPWRDVCKRLDDAHAQGDVVLITARYMRKPLAVCYTGTNVVPFPGKGKTTRDVVEIARGYERVWLIYSHVGSSSSSDRNGEAIALLERTHVVVTDAHYGPLIRLVQMNAD